MTDPLPDDRRRVIFADLVAAQDEGLAVTASRDLVAARYGVSPEQVREIEREGLDAGWPPLS
jgi:hypothetical protein